MLKYFKQIKTWIRKKFTKRLNTQENGVFRVGIKNGEFIPIEIHDFIKNGNGELVLKDCWESEQPKSTKDKIKYCELSSSQRSLN